MADILIAIFVILIAVVVIVGTIRRINRKLDHERELATAIKSAETKEEILELADQVELIAPSTARYIRSKKYLKERGFD